MNKFYRNYWDDKMFPTTKAIQGEMYCFEILFLLYDTGLINIPFEPRRVKWKSYDWFPAIRPYDIG